MQLRDLTTTQIKEAADQAKLRFQERDLSWRGRVTETDYGNAFTDGFRFLLDKLTTYPTNQPPNDPS